LLAAAMISACAPAPRTAAELLRLFRAHEAKRVQHALVDLGRQRVGVEGGAEVTPPSIDAVRAILRDAHQHGVAVRVRGRGHSKHGGSLPRAGELLLRTHRLRGVAFEGERVRVGAGVVLERLRQRARERGLAVPVFAAGGVGPSVGGFISAGGVGRGSARFGGFWDNVEELVLVDGRGDLRRFKPADPLFRWVFGAMGQLGVVVEATLRLVPERDVPPDPIELRADERERHEESHTPGPAVGPFWFTVFAPDALVPRAKREVEALLSAHARVLAPLPTILYPIRRVGRVPPLVYPREEAFTGIFFWGELRRGQTASAVLALERGLRALLRAEPRYARYVQSEIVPKRFDWREHFGPASYARLRAWKRLLDPKNLLNPGTIFPR
jgi:FAD/FMN-containing dehydrogenase